MKSWICSYLWMVLVLLTNISAEPSSSPRYAINQTSVSFDEAMKGCSRGGVLTTLATEQEVAEILRVISESFSPQTHNKLEFWVGLRKLKEECVVPTLPLRGFKWIEDGSEDSQVNQWIKEPEDTCTTVRCAKLQVNLHEPTRRGLIPVTCKDMHQFICKLTGGTMKPPKPATPAAPDPKPATTEPTTTKPEPATTEPVTAKTELATTAPHQPEPRPTSQKPEPTGTEPPTQRPEVDLKPDLGSEAVPESGSCQLPDIAHERSIILDHNNRSRIQVECWTGDPVELHCSGHPPVWRLPDNSPANLTSICQRCDNGFKRDTSGNCVDVDECSGGEARCRDTCLNTEGSFRCVCTDEDGKHQDEDSPACMDTPKDGNDGALSGILIWVLIAVGALLVLVVLVAVTVKCCLMRRSKKRAMKKAEKMAMKSKDDKDSVNEKVAI